jgi:hypothetical protein
VIIRREPEPQFNPQFLDFGFSIHVCTSARANEKGRVERTFGTLQDRLVKEMRLASICTQEEANRFLEIYLPKHNKRFSKRPLRAGDFHQPLSKRINLEEIFCLNGMRTINNGYIIKWKSRRFAIGGPSIAMNRRKKEIA